MHNDLNFNIKISLSFLCARKYVNFLAITDTFKYLKLKKIKFTFSLSVFLFFLFLFCGIKWNEMYIINKNGINRLALLTLVPVSL